LTRRLTGPLAPRRPDRPELWAARRRRTVSCTLFDVSGAPGPAAAADRGHSFLRRAHSPVTRAPARVPLPWVAIGSLPAQRGRAVRLRRGFPVTSIDTATREGGRQPRKRCTNSRVAFELRLGRTAKAGVSASTAKIRRTRAPYPVAGRRLPPEDPAPGRAARRGNRWTALIRLARFSGTSLGRSAIRFLLSYGVSRTSGARRGARRAFAVCVLVAGPLAAGRLVRPGCRVHSCAPIGRGRARVAARGLRRGLHWRFFFAAPACRGLLDLFPRASTTCWRSVGFAFLGARSSPRRGPIVERRGFVDSIRRGRPASQRAPTYVFHGFRLRLARRTLAITIFPHRSRPLLSSLRELSDQAIRVCRPARARRARFRIFVPSVPVPASALRRPGRPEVESRAPRTEEEARMPTYIPCFRKV